MNLQENLKADSSKDEPSYSEATLGVSQTPTLEEHKVLGVPWNSESDRLIFDVTNLARLAIDLHLTKRNLVSLIGKFYDPLGFFSPMIIRYKILFQKLCQCKSGWEKIIPDKLLEEWRSLISDLNMALHMSLPRSYLGEMTDPLVSAMLCGFCDASTKAYAAVVYLLLKTETHSVVSLLLPRRGLHPYKVKLSLGTVVCPSPLETSCFCAQQSTASDSTARHKMFHRFSSHSLLGLWLGKGVEAFVQNQVKEIRGNVHHDLLHHCPGITNPADLPSRGLTLMELSVSQLWCNGPEWLGLDSSVQSDVKILPMPELCSQELKIDQQVIPQSFGS